MATNNYYKSDQNLWKMIENALMVAKKEEKKNFARLLWPFAIRTIKNSYLSHHFIFREISSTFVDNLQSRWIFPEKCLKIYAIFTIQNSITLSVPDYFLEIHILLYFVAIYAHLQQIAKQSLKDKIGQGLLEN